MGGKKPLVDFSCYQPGRSVMKRGEIRLKPSYCKGLYIGRIIAPETGFFHATTTLDLYHLPADGKTVPYRQDEILLHVLTGNGYSIIGGERYDWEYGDTMHIKPGYWHQHWNTSKEAANMLAIRTTPLLKHFKAYAPAPVILEGAEYTPVGDWAPDHPFGLGKQELVVEVDEESPGRPWAKWVERMREKHRLQMKEAKTIMKGKDIRWEKESTHGGETNAQLADQSTGFDTRTVDMAIQAMPPMGSNETHIHGEAIVYMLAGKGYVLVNGEKYDLEEGDCVFVHSGDVHQFWSTSGPDETPFTQMRILSSIVLMNYIFPFPWIEEGEDPTVPDFDTNYHPQLPW